MIPNPQMVTMDLVKRDVAAPLRIEPCEAASARDLVWLPLSANPSFEAAEAARKSDVVVAVVGITSHLEGEEMKALQDSRAVGRKSLALPDEEEAMLGALKGSGELLVVVLMNGSALAVNWANSHANAIIDAWYSGENCSDSGWNRSSLQHAVTFYKGIDHSRSSKTMR